MSLATIGAVIGLFFFFAIMILALFSIIIGLPGNWIILAEALIYGAITGWDKGIAGWDLLVLAAMAGTGELAEFLLTAYGASKYGASKKAIAGALVGGLVGAILVNMVIPIIGAVIGAFLGVYLGAFLLTYAFDRDLEKARNSGLGAFMGRLGAVLVKGSMGVAMVAVIISQII
jgi:uncharacterized protein YqgC (DUF456 family)